MRLIFLCLSFLAVVACTDGRDLEEGPAPLGDFMLGHSIVIAPNLTKGPLSRDATKEEWIAAVDKAFEDRFRRYEGEKLYHFGISVEGYVLAQVGIPLVLQPKSLMIYRITVWDDAAQSKMNSEAHEVTVLEAVSAESVAGSGLTQTREEQMENLAILAAKQAEEWLVKQNKKAKWFNGFDATAAAAAAKAKNQVKEDRAKAKEERAKARAEAKAAREEAKAAKAKAKADAADAEAAAALDPVVEVTDADGKKLLVVEPLEAVADPDVSAFSSEAETASN